MSEKNLENTLVEKIRSNNLDAIKINLPDGGIQSLEDICGEYDFDVIQDDSRWNTHSGLMQDVIGGMIPDIVLRSKASGQNRIHIEVKEHSSLNYSTADSQAVRYFLHLLATSERKPHGKQDVGRAFLLAAPKSWFETPKTSEAWTYFIEKYADLAKSFGIVLGSIVLSQN